VANMTIQNPGLGKLFSGLASALGGGDAESLIRADLAKTQRDNVLSDTAINQSKLATLQRQETAMKSLADILGDPTLATTAEGRASLMSVLSQVPDGLQYGPGFALGSSTFTNPQVFNDADLSKAALGTGVVSDYANTPTGLAQTLAGDMEKAALQEQGDTYRKILEIANPGSGSGRVPPTVEFDDVEAFSGAIDEALANQFGGTAVDPQLRDALIAHAVQLFQQSRNAPMAVQQALADFEMAQTTEGASNAGVPFQQAGAVLGPLLGAPASAIGGMMNSPGQTTVTGAMRPGANTSVLPQVVIPPDVAAATNTPVLPQMMQPAAPAAPAAPAPPAPVAAPAQAAPAAVPGAIPPEQLPAGLRNVTQAPDGSFVWTAPNGQQMVLEEGQTFVSPTTGQRIMWQGGQWVQVQ